MAFDSVFVHSEILKKSFNLEKVKNQIEKNGIIELTKPKLDLFTFISQTIISQQISNKVAQSIWKKFCLLLKTDFPKIEDIRSKKKLSYLLKDIGILNTSVVGNTKFDRALKILSNNTEIVAQSCSILIVP